MPAWWGRKSSKHKEENQVQPNSPSINHHHGFFNSPARTADKRKGKEKTKSFDGVLTRGSPRQSREFSAGSAGGGGGGPSSAFSGFDSDGCRGLPLPRPSVSSTPGLGNDHGVGLGSGSASVSSVSSSGSSEDHANVHENGQFGAFRFEFELSIGFSFPISKN